MECVCVGGGGGGRGEEGGGRGELEDEITECATCLHWMIETGHWGSIAGSAIHIHSSWHLQHAVAEC